MIRHSNPGETVRLAALIAAAVVASVLTGCGTGVIDGVPTAVQGAAMQGTVHGGQQVVSGSTIQLYAVGTGGYGSAATPLIASTVKSDANGNFSIAGDFTCPSASTPVYLTATGGNSGYTSNPNLAMMAGLGACGNIQPFTFVFIDEVTTVATVWALSPFMSGPANIGAPASNALGLANAFDDIPTLANTAHGVSPGPLAPTGAVVPTSEIYTLADVLGTCINSGGGLAGSSTACGTLFTATKVGGVAPTDTITAAVNIAQHPAVNVATLYGLATAQGPFQPTLPTQPTDFTVSLVLTVGLVTPTAMAADASGNIWVVSQGASFLSKFSHNGTGVFGYSSTLNAPTAIAIDSSGNAWIANSGNSTISRVSSSGSAIGSPLTGGGLNTPRSIAFDSQGNAWIANYTSTTKSLSEFNSSGTALSGSGYTGVNLTAPAAIAISPH